MNRSESNSRLLCGRRTVQGQKGIPELPERDPELLQVCAQLIQAFAVRERMRESAAKIFLNAF